MAVIKVLIEGYAKELENGWLASSTCCLITSEGKKIITDPGCNREKLLSALKNEGLSTGDIDFVILSHSHLDHCLLAGIFENAIILDNSETYSFEGKIGEHEGRVLGTDIEIIKTPGHDQFHCSVLVNDDKLGKVVIASDVFWWKDDETQKTDKESLMKHEDPYVKDKDALVESRKKLLELADYIIPGHGKMFKVKK